MQERDAALAEPEVELPLGLESAGRGDLIHADEVSSN